MTSSGSTRRPDGAARLSIRVIRSAGLSPRPWRNGGGATLDLAASPPGAGLVGFDWRLSLADIERPGPFSLFEGTDRTLVLAAGERLRLTIGAIDHPVTEGAPVVRFAGEDAVVSGLPSGPVRVFNVMTRRAILSHAVRVVPAGPVAFERSGAILAHRTPVDFRTAEAVVRLGLLDIALIEGPVVGTAEAACIAVAFNAPPQPPVRA